MPAAFAPAFKFMMDHEDPRREGVVTSDSGGLTRWGISQRAYPHLDIRNLALEDAAAIYRNDYFKPIRGYDIDQQRVASKLFDMAVNMGIRPAVRILQSVLNTEAHPRIMLLLKEDGLIGPSTIIATNNADSDLLLIGLVELSREHYREIVRANPDDARYLDGWLARAEKLPPSSTA